MESTTTNYNKWNPYTLRKAKDSLLDSSFTQEHSDELMIITYLLDHNCQIAERNNNGDFIRVFQANNQIFEDYEEYLKYIWECYDYQRLREREEREDVLGEKLRVRPYAKLDVSYEYIMAKLDRFMDSLDDEWYEIFYALYTNRKDVIKLSKDSTGTLYLPKSDLWLANVEKKDSIEDYANIAMIYGEGIAAKLRRKCEKTVDNEILIKAFAKAIQYLFMAKLDDFGIQREVTKFFTSDYSENAKRVKTIFERFAIDATIKNPKSIKDVAYRLNMRFGTKLDRKHLEEIYKYTVRRDIQKVLADLIQRELLFTYENDRDKFTYNMKALVTSEDSPAKTLEKLNIDLNSIYIKGRH